jgi:hypothetical protein
MSHGTYSKNSIQGGYARKTRFYLNDGSNLFRLLPPFASMAEKGIIAKYWEVYWVEGSDKKKRPMPSILKTKFNGKGVPKTILVQDPMYSKIEALKAQVAAMKADPNQPVAIVAALEERLKYMNLDKAYYVNVISPSGEIGVLKLRFTGFQNLKTRLDELDKEGIDPINLGDGIIFDFKKMKDDNNKTTYPVDIAMKTYRDQTSGKFISEMQTYKIDENTLKRMDTEASDLGTLYKTLTAEEVALVATLDPKMVDRVFSRPVEVDDAEELYEDEVVGEVSLNKPAAAAAVKPQVAVTLATATLVAPPQQQVPVAAPVVAAAANNAEVQSIVDRFLANGKV